MTTAAASYVTGQGLVHPELFDRLVARLVREHDYDHHMAARIMDQALVFLAACASTAEPLSPSKQVDVGWHTFILYTRDYAEFCQRSAGRFIHHEPTDSPDTLPEASPSELNTRTVQAIRRAGYTVDETLWAVSANCSQCAEGCTHSGGGQGECHFRPTRHTNDPVTVP